MAKGHIRLGTSVALLREYQVYYERYRKLQVNPYSAKLSTGGDEYDDLGPWAYHVERDWQAGIGKIREDDGGVLFSTAETRVPGMIMLPQYLFQEDTIDEAGALADGRNLYYRAADAGTITVGPAETWRTIEISLSPPASVTKAFCFGILGWGSATSVAAVVSDGNGHTYSGTLVVPTSQNAMPSWYLLSGVDLVASSLAGAGAWTITLTPANGTLVLPCTAKPTNVVIKYHNGTSLLTSAANHCPVFTTNLHGILTATASTGFYWAVGAVRFNGTLYSAIHTSILKRNATTGVWASVATAAAVVSGLVVFGNYMYVSHGGFSSNYQRLSTADVLTTGAFPLNMLDRWNGYLYGVSDLGLSYTGLGLYYTGDGTTWTGPIIFAPSDEYVRGMAGLQSTIWVSTTDGLYYLAPGNVMRGVLRWHSRREGNGLHLTQFQGMLFALSDGGVQQIQVSETSGTMMDIWSNRSDDLLVDYLGAPVAMCASNNWLVVLARNATTRRSTLWAWSGQGWHFLSELPMPHTYYADQYPVHMAYDYVTSAIRITSGYGFLFAVRVPDATINPINDTSSRYAYAGWMETPWIIGGLADVEKDFESVYISGEELAAGQTVTVFWKVRGGSWTELGTVDADGEELRWSTYASRPTAKEIKLGFRLFSNDLTKTPTIDAIRLKYRPNVTDRWQWSLVLPFHDNQEMIDGDLNSYTGAQMLAHFEGLVKQTPPFFMEDVDGTQYEVVCTGYDLNLEKFEYYDTGKKVWWIAQATLEQSYAA